MQKVKQRIPRSKIIVIVLVVVLIALLFERFITQGTFLGYSPRQNKNSFNTTSVQPSKMCDRVTADEARIILGTGVERTATNLADVAKPVAISVCSYRGVDNPTSSVTLVLRDYSSPEQAKQQVDSLQKRSGIEKIDGVGDSAYYAPTSRQLTAYKYNEVATVSISATPTGQKVDIVEITKQFAEQIFK